jgi:hypothetical protein
VVQNNCIACHSADYINTQPRGEKFKKDFWQAEVTRMIKVYGAPIDDANVGKIVDYPAARRAERVENGLAERRGSAICPTGLRRDAAGTSCFKLRQIREKARNAPRLRSFSPKIAIPFWLSSRLYPAYPPARERAGACGDRRVVLFF